MIAPVLAQKTIILWPDAPADPSVPSEQVAPDPKGGPTARAISQVVQPSLTVYLPPADKANGTGILVCPGGGYTQLMIDREGHQVARWLNTLGVAAFVLKYRLPGATSLRTPPQDLRQLASTLHIALDDAKEAMRIIRSRAPAWRLQPNHIGMMGFSAGGHLAAMMGMLSPREVRPDFLALLYPGIPPVLEVDKSTPPAFLAAAHNDPRISPADHCVRFYIALKKAGVPAELLVYSSGGHGFALRKEDGSAAAWPEAFAAWLAEWQRR
ncbi:MAG: alpha/beta hydrolase [Acidobacteria bacterium]|nr:alpha/beta hydrolase [Acidobacteriota bacterium]